ncbi:hypothetical protein pb186bvf_017573 [Paramecium bursaria]
MKKQKEFHYKFLYFQKSYDIENVETRWVTLLGFGTEIIQGNEIYFLKSDNHKQLSNDIMLFKQKLIKESELLGILKEYTITDDDIKLLITERSEELYDQFTTFKHQVNKDQYISVFPNATLIFYTQIEQEQVIQLDEASACQLVTEHLQWLGLNRIDEISIQSMRILNKNGYPQQFPDHPQQEFEQLVDKVEFENSIKFYVGDNLFKIPEFNKETASFNWENMHDIPQNILQM